MWIRSQNKKFLVYTKSVGIFHGRDDYCRIQCLDNKIYDSERIILGHYTTSEKANEVLDMIQESIQYGTIVIDMIQEEIQHGAIVKKTEKFDVCREAVFEMPQDDEV